MNQYINIRDYEGGTWALGEVATIQDWKELAMTWADSDENYGAYNYIKNHKNDENLLDFISDFWQIEIVKFDKNNKEHIKLAEERNKN